MLRPLLSKEQARKVYGKLFKPCHVVIHWIILVEYAQMSTHVPEFLSYFRFFASFCFGQISHQQHKGEMNLKRRFRLQNYIHKEFWKKGREKLCLGVSISKTVKNGGNCILNDSTIYRNPSHKLHCENPMHACSGLKDLMI